MGIYFIKAYKYPDDRQIKVSNEILVFSAQVSIIIIIAIVLLLSFLCFEGKFVKKNQ